MLSTTSMRARAATVTACALTLAVAGCGSDKEASSGGLSTAASAPAASGAGATDASAAAGSAGASASASQGGGDGRADKANKDNKDSGTNAAANQGGNGDVPTVSNPFGEGDIQAPTYQPIAGGKEGSEEDRRQIEEVSRAVTNPDSFAGWTRTILDNSCAAIRDPAMQQFESQGLTLDMVEEIMKNQSGDVDIPKTDVSVSDVRVDGDRASATVTTTNSGGTASQVQLYAREDGRWKVCTDQ